MYQPLVSRKKEQQPHQTRTSNASYKQQYSSTNTTTHVCTCVLSRVVTIAQPPPYQQLTSSIVVVLMLADTTSRQPSSSCCCSKKINSYIEKQYQYSIQIKQYILFIYFGLFFAQMCVKYLVALSEQMMIQLVYPILKNRQYCELYMNNSNSY